MLINLILTISLSLLLVAILLIILKYLFFLRDGLVWKYIHMSVLLLSQSCMLVRLISVDFPILREACGWRHLSDYGLLQSMSVVHYWSLSVLWCINTTVSIFEVICF